MPNWAGRISPVLDVAKRLVFVYVENGVESGRSEIALTETGPARRAAQIAATMPTATNPSVDHLMGRLPCAVALSRGLPSPW